MMFVAMWRVDSRASMLCCTDNVYFSLRFAALYHGWVEHNGNTIWSATDGN